MEGPPPALSVWLADEHAGSDDDDDDGRSDVFHDAQASPLLMQHTPSMASASRRHTLYLPASSSASTSTTSVSTVGKERSSSRTTAREQATSSGHQAKDRLHNAAARLSLADPTPRRLSTRTETDDDGEDDDWAGFISSGYKAFPLPPPLLPVAATPAHSKNGHAASLSRTASCSTSSSHSSNSSSMQLGSGYASFLRMSGSDSPTSTDWVTAAHDTATAEDGAWVSSDEEREELKSAVTPRADFADVFDSTLREQSPREVLEEDVNVKSVTVRQAKEVDDSPEASNRPEDSPTATKPVKKSMLRFSTLQERDAADRSTALRHTSTSSASSLLSSRLSRQFSIAESISTRPSTLYGHSECHHGLAPFEEVSYDSVDSTKLAQSSIVTLSPKEDPAELASTLRNSRRDCNTLNPISHPIDSQAADISPLDKVSESEEEVKLRRGGSRPKRKGHKKKSTRNAPATAPVAPLRVASLGSRRHHEKRVSRLELDGIEAGSPERPLLGRWLEDAAKLEQESPHALFARELCDHLTAQRASLALDDALRTSGEESLEHVDTRLHNQAATNLRKEQDDSVTPKASGQWSRLSKPSLSLDRQVDPVSTTTPSQSTSLGNHMPSRAADAETATYSQKSSPKPMRIRLCGYDATIAKADSPTLTSDQGSAKLPVLKRLKSMPRVLQSKMRRDASANKDQMPLVSSEADAALDGGPFASSQHMPSPRHVSPSSLDRTPTEKRSIFTLRKKPSRLFIEEFSDQSSRSKKSSSNTMQSAKLTRPSLQLDRLAASVSTFKTGNDEWASCNTASTQARKSTDAVHALSVTVEENVRRFVGESEDFDRLLGSQTPPRLADSLNTKQ